MMMGTEMQRSARDIAAADRAQRLLQAGRHADALRVAQDVLSQDPQQIGALETMAKALWHLGRFEELVRTLRRLVVLNPYEPGYHSLLGTVYQSMGQCGEAVEAFSRCATGNGTEGEMARESIAALQEWQGGLVAELLTSDPVFRAHYAQNPDLACRQRGFAFSERNSSAENWLPEQAVVSLHNRPS